MSPDPPPLHATVVRSDSARIGSGIWAVGAALLTVDVLRRGHGSSSVAAVAALVAVSVIVHALAWRPEVRLGDDALTIVNPTRTITIPWDAVTSVGGSWSLDVRTTKGTFTPWVSGPRSRKDIRKGVGPGLSAAITTRWEQAASGSGDAVPTVQWHRWTLLALAVPALLFAVAVRR